MKKIIFVMMMLIGAMSVNAVGEVINQEALTENFLFNCEYMVEENKHGIKDITLVRTFEGEEFFECPTLLTVPLKVVEEKEISQDEAVDGFEYDCTYVEQENAYELEVPNITLTFDSKNYFGCPSILLEFVHTEDLSVSSVPRLWAQIEEGETKEYDVDKAAIPVNEVEFSVKQLREMEDFENVEIAISTVSNPTSSLEVKDDVFEYIRLRNSGIESDDVSAVDVHFYVPKAWIQENNILPDSIKLYRHRNGAWGELFTEMVEENPQNYNFRGVSPGFSLFAIAGDHNESVQDGEDQGDQDEEQDIQDGVDNETTPPAEDDEGLTTMQWGGIIIIAILIVGLIIWAAIVSRR